MRTLEETLRVIVDQNDLGFSRIAEISDQQLFDLMQKLGIKSQNFFIVLEELIINGREHGDGSQ